MTSLVHLQAAEAVRFTNQCLASQKGHKKKHRNKTVKLRECDSFLVDASFVPIFGCIQR